MISGWAASRPPVNDPNAGRISLVAEATKQRIKNLSKRAAKGDRAAQMMLPRQLARLEDLLIGEVVYE